MNTTVFNHRLLKLQRVKDRTHSQPAAGRPRARPLCGRFTAPVVLACALFMAGAEPLHAQTYSGVPYATEPALANLDGPVAAAAAAAVPNHSLACQRATITLVPCPAGNSCGPGGGVGMSQVTGLPSTASNVTGGAVAGGFAPTGTRLVDYQFYVPDVRVFAPDGYKTLLTPYSTRTWVVKSSAVTGGEPKPVAVAGSWNERHPAGDVNTGFSGPSDTVGNTSTTGSWLLLGQVTASAYMRGMAQYVVYGFSCRLPVQNLILQTQLQ